MADGQFRAVVGAICRAAAARTKHTDRQLLEQFAAARDQAAFTALVRRHGGLVLGVCRRVLRHEQDAEDAFQATFLVLARKARSVRWHESVANWLHGVAYRLALKLRSANARRQARIREAAAATPEDNSGAPAAWQELRSVLDEELARLPEKFRAPLVLCYLQGKTRDEAAQQLGWTLPTVKGRLERGRELLRSRLTRRGLALSAALCGAGLIEGAAAAAPPALVSGTVTAALQFAAGQAVGACASAQALTLTQGVLRAMFLTKLKMIAAVMLTVGALGIGTGAVSRQVLAVDGEQPSAPSPARIDAVHSEVDPLFESLFEEEPVEVAQARERDGRRGDETAQGKEVRCRLKTIDLEKGTLTVSPIRDGNREDETFSLAAKDVQVKGDRGNPLKLADLKSGMPVTLRLSATDDVVGIVVLQAGGRGREEPGRGRGDAVRGGGVAGLLKAVDANKKTVIVTVGREGRTEDRTYEVTDGTRIAVPGTREAKLTDLKVGMRVLVVPAAEGRSLVALMAQPAGDARGDRPAVVGRLKAVDLDKKTITVAVGRGDDKEQTFTLPADVKVMGLGREPKTAADLKPGMTVGLKVGENGKDVTLIYASTGEREGAANTTQGVLKSVDAAKGTITMSMGREGQEKEQTFQLAKEVRVVTSRREQSKLEDLKAGMRVMLVLSRDRESVVGVMIVVPGERGRQAPQEPRRPREER